MSLQFWNDTDIGRIVYPLDRKSLSKFKKYLNLENPNHSCFHIGQMLDPKILSIDYVIPWPCMFSDDRWNLEYEDKSINASKSNRISNKKTIEKLKKTKSRNLQINPSGWFQEQVYGGTSSFDWSRICKKVLCGLFWSKFLIYNIEKYIFSHILKAFLLWNENKHENNEMVDAFFSLSS